MSTYGPLVVATTRAPRCAPAFSVYPGDVRLTTRYYPLVAMVTRRQRIRTYTTGEPYLLLCSTIRGGSIALSVGRLDLQVGGIGQHMMVLLIAGHEVRQ